MKAPSTQTSAPLLRTNGLCKRFRKRTAVSELSLTVNRGDVYGFLGPNGAGKTTTMRMVVGLIRPTGGSVSIAGEQLTFWNRAPLRRIGASIESPGFYGYLSGRDNLRMFADLTAPCPDKRIDEVLDRVGMLPRAKDRVRIYSHGMKQRLAIAAALLPSPELVLIDEPTNGRDPMGIRDVRELLASLARDDGYTIFLSSHLLAEVEQICNRGAILVEGNKLWEGEVADLLATKRRIRLRASPFAVARQTLEKLGATVVESNGTPATRDDAESTSEDGRLFFAMGADIRCDAVVAALVAAGCRVFEVVAEVPPLEDVFVELVTAKESA